MRPILKGEFIMVNIDALTPEQKEELAFTEKEQEELKKARTMKITFDADCPETTPERALKFKRVNPPREKAQRA